MNDRSLTKTRAEALAAYIATLRTDWQTPGILAALHKAKNHGDAYEHGIWAIRAAADPANRTPAVIALEGRHRKPADPDDTRTVTRDPTTHIGDMRCPRCPHWVVRGEPHTCAPLAEPDPDRLAAIKAAIAPPPPARPVEDVELPEEES